MTRGAVLYLNKALPMNLVLEDSSTDGHLCACLLTLVKCTRLQKALSSKLPLIIPV